METQTSVQVLAAATLKPVGQLVQRMEGMAADASQLATLGAELHRDVTVAMGAIDWVHVQAAAREAAQGPGGLGIGEVVRMEGLQLGRHDRATCALLRPIEAELPMSTSWILGRADVMTPPFLLAWWRSRMHLWDARQLRGEPLSEALRSMSTAVIDSVYYTYVDVVYRADCVRRRQPMHEDRGGNQVRQLREWLPPSDASMLDADAPAFRNAAAHHRRWEYEPAEDVIAITGINPSRPPLKIRPRTLYRRYLELWRQATSAMMAMLSVAGPAVVELYTRCGITRACMEGDETLVDQAQFAALVGPTFALLERLDVPKSRREVSAQAST